MKRAAGDEADTGSAARRAARSPGVAAVVTAVVLHLAVLGGVALRSPGGSAADATPPTARPLDVRLIAAPSRPGPTTPADTVETASAGPVAVDLRRPASRQKARARPVVPPRAAAPAEARPASEPEQVAAADPRPAVEPPADLVAATVPDAAVVATAPRLRPAVYRPADADPSLRVATAATGGEPDPATEPIPHYRTQVPPSVLLRYDVRRGALSGSGQIDWRGDGTHYDLKLDFRYAGLALLQQTSSGGFDADGLAPQRFVDQRIRRSAQAANFQRATGRLTYSGSADEYPLRPGAQDRLSWMVQLAAIVAGDPPTLARPGARVTMFVTGARGDVGIWTFRCVAAEPFELRAGRIPTLKFVREARFEHDTTVEAWLDPAVHYLPAAASQRSGPDDEPYELRRVEVVEAH